MITEVKYIGPLAPYAVPGVGVFEHGDVIKVASDQAEYLLAQKENFEAVEKKKDIK